jgi:hypothetical protein
MKRFVLITCSFLVLFSGVAAAWEDCKRISFSSESHHHRSPVPVHAHDHHGDADHEHSRGTIVHCPPFTEFLVTATVSVGSDQRVERLLNTLIGEFQSQYVQQGSYRLIHGPPGSAHSRIIPPYLMLSVLRI